MEVYFIQILTIVGASVGLVELLRKYYFPSMRKEEKTFTIKRVR